MHSLGTHGAPMPKPHFKAPEGRYELVCDRLGGLCNFNAARMPRLSLAQLLGGDEAGTYLLFSVGDALHVCRYAETAKVSDAASRCACKLADGVCALQQSSPPWQYLVHRLPAQRESLWRVAVD